MTMEKVEVDDIELDLRRAYQYFRITADGMTNDDLQNVELEFKVSNEWLEENELNEDFVFLNMYENNAWRRVPTFRAGSANGDTYYIATVKEYMLFAITAEPKVEPPPKQAVEDEEEVAEVMQEVEEEPKKSRMPLIRLTKARAITFLLVIILLGAGVVTFFAVKKAHHPYPKLVSYIKSSLDEGRNKSQIRNSLLRAGWPQNIVDDELKKYKTQWLKR
jgi:hypothetical protein